MNSAIAIWLAFRALRWLFWLGFLGYSLAYISNPVAYLNSFGHLLPSTELAFFGLGLGALFAGFLELMMRERTGLDRPAADRGLPAALAVARGRGYRA